MNRTIKMLIAFAVVVSFCITPVAYGMSTPVTEEMSLDMTLGDYAISSSKAEEISEKVVELNSMESFKSIEKDSILEIGNNSSSLVGSAEYYKSLTKCISDSIPVVSLDGVSAFTDSNLDMHLGDGNLNVDENVDVDEKLIGAKVGDTVTIEFTFPEDYDDSSIAGKKCELAVSINMIEKEVIPEVNDALVKENTDCKTVKEYKKQVRDSLVSDKKSEAEQTNQETLWNKIMDNATQLKDFSEADIKKEVSNIKIENKEMAGYFGMSVSDFIEQYYEMSLEDYAKENLKKQCVQDLLLKENSIEITDADVDEEIQYYIDELGYKDKKEVLSAISEDEIHSELQYTKLMDALMKETTIK